MQRHCSHHSGFPPGVSNPVGHKGTLVRRCMLGRRCTVCLMLLAGTELLLQGAEKKQTKKKQKRQNKLPAWDAPTIISKALLPASPSRREWFFLHFPSRSVSRLQTQPHQAFHVALCPADIFYFTGKMGQLRWVRLFFFFMILPPFQSRSVGLCWLVAHSAGSCN